MFKKLTNTLESLLDQESNRNFVSELGLVEARKNFIVSEKLYELENLSYAHSNEINSENFGVLLDQLSYFFEMSFIFKKKPTPVGQNSLWKCSYYQPNYVYLYGQKITTPHLNLQTQLPKAPLYKVLKTKAHSFLRKFKLQDLDTKKRMNCYLIHISENLAFVFISDTADPWAKMKIETLQQTLMRINFNL